MRKTFAAAAVALVFAGVANAQAAPEYPARITTSGEAQVRVTPDRATVLIGVQSRGTTATLAASDNARRQKAILDTLKAMGFGPDQLATQSYTANPEVRYEQPSGTSRVVGYNVSNVVRVEIRRIDQVGMVIDASLSKGANQINSIQFSSSTAAESRRAAMADAVRDARADAEALARAAGGRLGALLELISVGSPVRPVMMDMAMSQAARGGAQTPIEPGEQVISASVSTVWQFIPGGNR